MRARFPGVPGDLVNYFLYVAEEVFWGAFDIFKVYLSFPSFGLTVTDLIFIYHFQIRILL